MAEFKYQDPFPLSEDDTTYRLLTKDYVSTTRFDGEEILKIEPEALAFLANQAMRDVSFLLRPKHNEQVAKILTDPEASNNDRGVAIAMLRNAEVSAKFELPFCQDTGTATIIGKKGQKVWTGCKDEEFLSKGVFKTYTEENLRYSQTIALDMYEEINSGCNLPAQIDLYATEGNEYKFLFIAKGGGSANKTYPVPGNQSPAQSREPGKVPGGQDENPRHRSLPSLSPGICHRRHQRRKHSQNGQTRFNRLSGSPADRRQQRRPGLPRPGDGSQAAQGGPGSAASAPSSAASTLPTTCA